ncbi:MAG: nicotinamide riboside transporter PnuC [Candidatus Velthaea sp.]
MSPVEIAGFITGAISVWLAVRENIWNWPIGIANNVLYVIVFFNARLYADMSLQVVYVAISSWGIYQWRRGGGARRGLRVRHAAARELIGLALAIAAGSAVMATYLARINDAAPLLDASTAIASLGAQYLLARKFLENWYLWIAVDIVSVGLYLSRGLSLTALLYAIFLMMCIAGAVSWRKSLSVTLLRD